MYTHFKITRGHLVNVAQAAVRRNQMVTTLSTFVIAEVKRDMYSSFVIGIY
jgi:hypothetical protein